MIRKDMTTSLGQHELDDIGYDEDFEEADEEVQLGQPMAAWTLSIDNFNHKRKVLECFWFFLVYNQ